MTVDQTALANTMLFANIKASNQKLVLGIQKSTGQYLTAVLCTSSGKITKLSSFKRLDKALADYFSLGAELLSCEPSLIADLMTQSTTTSGHQNPQTGSSLPNGTFSLPADEHTPTTPMSVNNKQFHQRDHQPSPESKLTPSAFAVPEKAPEWLEAKKSFLELNAGIRVTKGEHFKLIAMNLKGKLPSQDSSIHLQDQHGKLMELALSQVCSCFMPGETQHWPINSTRRKDTTA